MVGFVKFKPNGSHHNGYDKRHTGPADQVLGLGFSVVSLGVGSFWKDPRLMGRDGEARLSSLVHRPATESVGISLWRRRRVEESMRRSCQKESSNDSLIDRLCLSFTGWMVRKILRRGDNRLTGDKLTSTRACKRWDGMGWDGTILRIEIDEMLGLFGLRLFPKEGCHHAGHMYNESMCRLVERHWLGKISGASFLARFKAERGPA